MQTPIGRTLTAGGPSLWFTTAIAAAVVGAFLALLGAGEFTVQRERYLAAIVIVSFGSVAILRRDRASFGLRLSPVQGWAYWAKVTILMGAVLLLITLAVAGVGLGLLRFSIPARYTYIHHPSYIWPLFVSMCVTAPLLEEVVFRLAICPPMAAWLGPKAAIATSGVLFAALHVLAGNPDPNNLLAGFILGWAFLKSGALAVPMALHSLGNLCAFAYHVIHFYWFA